MSKRKEEHPFFCHKKQCRKTAWDTPEYLTEEDWGFAEEFVRLVKTGDGQKAFDWIWDRDHVKHAEAFFNRVLGWPEGHVYCRENSYWLRTAVPGLLAHSLPKLEQALVAKGKA